SSLSPFLQSGRNEVQHSLAVLPYPISGQGAPSPTEDPTHIDGGMDFINWFGCDGQVGVHHFQGVMARKRDGAGQHLIESHTQRIQIRAVINRLMHPSALLRRQVGQGSLESVWTHDLLRVLLASRGHPEINELDHPRVGVDDDIVRMDVQMHNPAEVYRFEPLGQLQRDAQKGGERKAPRWYDLGERRGPKILGEQAEPKPSACKAI